MTAAQRLAKRAALLAAADAVHASLGNLSPSTLVPAVYRNADDEVSGEVFESGRRNGGFGAALRDDESGRIVSSIHGFPAFDAAAVAAQRMARAS